MISIGFLHLSRTDIELIGYASAALGVLMLVMHTMIPLRVTGVAHNITQICFGLLTGLYPLVIQHMILLPINLRRLHQMTGLIGKVKHAANTNSQSMEWLKPFMDNRSVRKGEVLFNKGDHADSMYYVLSGKLAIADIGVELGENQVVGELGLLSPGQSRTHTVTAIEDGRLLVMPYSRIEQLYYQNPEFGFYFLRLSSARLFENIAQLEARLAQITAAPPASSGRTAAAASGAPAASPDGPAPATAASA
ncbi:MAG TPA: cyclic nucleotide-binding domain-containing protein [Rhizomicrobium sp.]|nr:cyclic nucleotide-binding domain-containing protein [Rhizomicrobium sp.]